MADLNPYKIIWRSLIESGSPQRVAEFDTQNDAENFILNLNMSKNREFIWANFITKD